MISESQEERRRGRVWAWAIPLSALLHALLVPLALWGFAQRLLISIAQTPPETVAASTAVRLERQPPVPRPRQLPAQPARTQQSTAARQAASAARPAAPSMVRPELESETPTPRPLPQTPAPSMESRIARDQQAFSSQVAAMNKANAALSIATSAPKQPSTYRRSYFDVPGNRAQMHEQAVLFPERHWIAGDASCYYASYVAQFSNGANESGVVPWPICYPRTDDPFAKYPSGGVLIPIPYPPPGYALPPGTFISAFLRRIYLHQI